MRRVNWARLASLSGKKSPYKARNLPQRHTKSSRRGGAPPIHIYIMELLEPQDDLSAIHKALQKSKKMLILTGAGISCSAGIPDFRSANGLYNTDCSGLRGKDLFDISVFQQEQHIEHFARFMHQLYTRGGNAHPTRTHRFIARQLYAKRALRCYTQNIDGLEEKLGLIMMDGNSMKNWKQAQCVQLHGDINTLRCTQCSTVKQWGSLGEQLQRGELPECPGCLDAKLIRQMSGKRIGGLTTGFLRPNIILYGEDHPHAEVITTVLNTDLKSKPDMLLIMGTSLKVHGVKQLVRTAARVVHARGGFVVLINDTVLNGWNGVIDYQVQTQCDEFFKHHESFEQQLLSPPTTPRKKRTVMLSQGGTKRKLTDITNVDQYKKKVPRGGGAKHQHELTKDAEDPY